MEVGKLLQIKSYKMLSRNHMELINGIKER
jgi:hypothetical protein